MKFRDFVETQDNERRRERGTSLKEKGVHGLVRIFRAVPVTVTTFKPMDYVGEGDYGRRFCKGHAEHQAVVMGEPYHVIAAVVKPEYVFEAHNPGEYFYDGPETPGRTVFGSRVNP